MRLRNRARTGNTIVVTSTQQPLPQQPYPQTPYQITQGLPGYSPAPYPQMYPQQPYPQGYPQYYPSTPQGKKLMVL